METAEEGLGAADEDGLAEVDLADAFVVVAFFVVASLDSVGLLLNLLSSSVTAAFWTFLVADLVSSTILN